MIGPMAQKNSETGDIVRAVGAILTDLFPLFMEKWSDLHDRPTMEELQRDQTRLERLTSRLVNQIRWFYPVFFVLLLWNILLTVFLFLQ